MDYTMAMNYINEKAKLGSKPGLVNIKELLSRLDNPQNKCKCLHIGGTNGKGSIFSFVQEILLKAGYKVGRYISPTIFDYRERFQINKSYISEERMCQILEKVANHVEAMIKDGYDSPTAFEIETAMAFLYFYEEKIDYVLVECGMGGLLDATNVIDEPVIVSFASISMDHMEFLGDTIEAIAKQKTGILKRGCACVSYPQLDAVKDVINEACVKDDISLVYADEKCLDVIGYSIDKTEFIYKDKKYTIKLLGEHQVKNAVTAIEIATLIDGVEDSHIMEGLEATTWSGRMTKVGENPLMFVDGAHNEDAWRYLRDSINKYFTNKSIIYIIGVLKDKEYHKMIDILKDTMTHAITVTPNTPRGLDKAILAGLLEDVGVSCHMADTSEEAISLAKSIAKEEDVILVSGSLSFIGEYLK